MSATFLKTFKIAETLLTPTDVAQAFESVVNSLMAPRALADQRDALLQGLVPERVQVSYRKAISGGHA